MKTLDIILDIIAVAMILLMAFGAVTFMFWHANQVDKMILGV